MAMQYTLQTCKAKDKIGLMRVLGILAQNIRGHPFEVITKYTVRINTVLFRMLFFTV